MVRQEKSESYLSEVQQNIMYKRMRAERRQEARRRKKKKKMRKWENRGDGNSLYSENRQGRGALLQPPTV